MPKLSKADRDRLEPVHRRRAELSPSKFINWLRAYYNTGIYEGTNTKAFREEVSRIANLVRAEIDGR